MKQKVLLVTGSRADYGLWYWLFRALRDSKKFEPSFLVTGSHLSDRFGKTVNQIRDDGHSIEAEIPSNLEDNSRLGVARALGEVTEGMAKELEKSKPDLLLILGDRYEMFGAAQAGLILGIPLGHIFGGDITEGAFDDAMRHAMTKMSHLHFVTHSQAADRVLQMGEDPQMVFNVGSLGIDGFLKFPKMNRLDLEKDLGFQFREKNLLITFHPETISTKSSDEQISPLLLALEKLPETVGLIFTLSNADPGAVAVSERIQKFAASHQNAVAATSLGSIRYLSLMALVDGVVGNSSSGIYETPSFQVGTLNIGNRQKGRLAAKSVLQVSNDLDSIQKGIQQVLTEKFESVTNPYGDGNTAEKIVQILEKIPNFKSLLNKSFHQRVETES
ncbi:MAG: UDP-N-acetylglucosamine 2-epimerase [Verrucomicrobiota bacterium]